MQRQEEKPLRERARQEPLEERARGLFIPPGEITKARFNSRAPADQILLLTLYKLSGGKYVLNNKTVNQLSAGETYDILKSLGVANGIRMALVSEVDAVNDLARLEIHFFNKNYLDEIRNTYTADQRKANLIFPISGGHRLPAGTAKGQVQVDSRPAPAPQSIIWPDLDRPVLLLTVTPIGDYSTYTLSLHAGEIAGATLIDPLFAEIRFKFRPGCFSTNCAPEWESAPKPEVEPVIDYLAKDYDSFRHTMIVAMMQRVPGWQPTSEADLDEVLLDLFSAAADELSDYQDRVMNEAYLASARKRVSLARHARLMDYHIHQGNQASTWLALELELGGALQELDLESGLEVWAGSDKKDEASSQVFITRNDQPQPMHKLLNSMSLYTWSNTITTLPRGSTSADLQLYLDLYLDNVSNNTSPAIDEASAVAVRDLISKDKVRYLLIEERLNPATGGPAGRDPGKRQLLRLLPCALAMKDPITNEWFVRVYWEEADALKCDYCFTIDLPQPKGRVKHVSLFHGNLIEVHHGRPKNKVFKEATAQLSEGNPNEFHYERNECRGTICELPDRDLAYLNTEPGGDEPPFSTLRVEVVDSVVGNKKWNEVPNLIHSDDSSEGGDHFVVETDEEGPDGGRKSRIRFGNGINGRKLPEGMEVHCEYQVGQGLAGNIGADRLIHSDENTLHTNAVGVKVRHCWNPFDVTNGRAPEPAAEIIRRVPEAYRLRQLRAVTLQDYVDRAEEKSEEKSEVSRAAASYGWTGSWRTVRVTIDPAGTNVLTDELRRKVAQYLDAVRLIGEDIEIRPPRFVPLDIRVSLCAHADYWPEDLKFVLGLEFSTGWTTDGRMGFFHPDLWTFGQPLHASQILGRLHSIEGVEHIISIAMKRWNDPGSGTDFIGNLRPNEIIQVQSDPDHMELGFINFEVLGGRR